MRRTKAVVVARSALLLAVAAATTNRLVLGLCLFGLARVLERYWEARP